MHVTDFRQMYLTELQETRSLEEMLSDALPRIAGKAADAELKNGLEEHASQTRSQLERVRRMLERHGVAPREHKDQSMAAMVEEAEKWAGMIDEPNLRDAGLIASAQRIEHYEIAVYGTLAAWAKQLGLNEDLDELLSILEEEKAADERLTTLAKRQVNPHAVH